MAKKDTYDAGSISVLEGLEAVPQTAGNVYRKCIAKGSEPFDLRDCG